MEGLVHIQQTNKGKKKKGKKNIDRFPLRDLHYKAWCMEDNLTCVKTPLRVLFDDIMPLYIIYCLDRSLARQSRIDIILGIDLLLIDSCA